MAETLYQRPGGIDGIRQLVKDAVDAHPLLSMKAAINGHLRRLGDIRDPQRCLEIDRAEIPAGQVRLQSGG